MLHIVGEQGRRNDPFAVAGQPLVSMLTGKDPGEAAFDRVGELCAGGLVLWADNAHSLDAVSLTLLRRLAGDSQSLPLSLLISTGPTSSRMQLTCPIRQTQQWLWLPGESDDSRPFGCSTGRADGLARSCTASRG